MVMAKFLSLGFVLLGFLSGGALPGCSGGSCPSEDAEHGDSSILQISRAARAQAASVANRSASLPYVHAKCEDIACGAGCGWTRSWSCPGQAKGSSGFASDDNSHSYDCCCKQELYAYTDAGLSPCDFPAVKSECEQYMCSSGCGWTSAWSCPDQKKGTSGTAGADDSQGYKCCCEAGLYSYADATASFACPTPAPKPGLPPLPSASAAEAAKLWLTQVDSKASAKFILKAMPDVPFKPLALVQEDPEDVPQRPPVEGPRLVCNSTDGAHDCHVEPPSDWEPQPEEGSEEEPEALLQREESDKPKKKKKNKKKTKEQVRLVKVTVEATQPLQTMVGFGAAMTHSSALTLLKLKKRDRDLYKEVVKRLFGLGDEDAGISVVRVPLGSSDFAVTAKTYDDLKQGPCSGSGVCTTRCSLPGKPCSSVNKNGRAGACSGGNCGACGDCCCAAADYSLSSFRIDADTKAIMEVLKDAKAFNSDLVLMGSPWSPPAWLKVKGELKGITNDNTLLDDTAAYKTYAAYFAKVKEAWAAEGLPLDYLTLQNEPLFAVVDYPGMYLSAHDYARLGKEVKKAIGDSPKLLMYDHNWNHYEYPEQGLDASPDAFAGTAFHCYGGTMSQAHEAVFRKHPNKDIMVTECTGSYPNNQCDISKGMDSFGWNHQWDMENVFLAAVLHHASAGIKWIMVLDEHCGPTLPGVHYQWGRPLVSIPGSAKKLSDIKFNQDFWTVAHMARFVRPGAKLVEAKVEGSNVIIGTFRDDTAGTITVIALNKDHSNDFKLQVDFEGKSLTYKVPAFSTAVLSWP